MVVHITDNQYVNVVSEASLTMHNLYANFVKFSAITKSCLNNLINVHHNLSAYPNRPRFSDAGIIALALSAEAIGIDSENLLYGKIRAEHPEWMTLLPDRTNYNRRKRRLRPFIDQCTEWMASQMDNQGDSYTVDSMPLPVCRLARFKQLKILRDDPQMAPVIGYAPIDKQHYAGYKLHMLSSQNGVIANFFITPANVHDVKVLEDISRGWINNCLLIGDKGYISRTMQLNLFESDNITLVTPNRANQPGPGAWDWTHRKQRKRIETTFSQFCDQMLIKRNYAKTFDGYYTRITTKIAAFTALQFINFQNNRPLNHTKYALAA